MARFVFGSAVAFAALLCLGFFNSTRGAGIVITLDPNIKYQTISGWEATAEVGQNDSAAFPKYKDQLYDLAVNDLGINRVRVEIKSGAENPTDYFAQYQNPATRPSEAEMRRHVYEIINDDNDPKVINLNGFHFSELDSEMENIVLPMRQRLQARGEQLRINVNYVDFGASSFEHKDHPDEYAEFVLATYQHLQSKYGVLPDAWEVILEPDQAAWSGAQIGDAVLAAGNRLIAAGFTPHFIAPSTSNMASAVTYFKDMLQGRNLLPFLSELSYHRYKGVSDGALQSIAAASLQSGIPTAMLEHIGSGYEDLHNDLKLGRNSAWQQFTLAYPAREDSGAQYFLIDDHDPNNPNIVMGSRTKFLRQYFKFIRSGAVRIEAATTDGNFDPLAFINRDGKYVIVVKANGAGEFGIQGLPAGQYGIKYTTDSQYDVDLPNATIVSGQLLNTAIPDRGVITVYAKQLAPPATPTLTRVLDTATKPVATKTVATKPAATKSPTALPAMSSPTPMSEQGAIATLAAGFGAPALTATRLHNAPTAPTGMESPTESLDTSSAPTNSLPSAGCILPVIAGAGILAGTGFLVRRKSRQRK